VDNQLAFWSLHPYVYGKTFPAFLFSPATATAATERKNGTAKRQRNGGSQELVYWLVKVFEKRLRKTVAVFAPPPNWGGMLQSPGGLRLPAYIPIRSPHQYVKRIISNL